MMIWTISGQSRRPPDTTPSTPGATLQVEAQQFPTPPHGAPMLVTIGILVLAWTAVSVLVGLTVGPLLRRREQSPPLPAAQRPHLVDSAA